MAVDLHTSGSNDSFLPPSTDLINSNNFNINGSDLSPLSHSSKAQSHSNKDKDDDLFDELTQHMQMAHIMLQHDHKFDSSDICSEDCESVKPWDTASSWSQSQSSLWSPLYSNQGSPEGSLSPKEQSSTTLASTYDVVGILGKMKLDETSQSNGGFCSSNEYLLNEQIRANQMSRLRQEQMVSLTQKLTAYRENHSIRSQKFGKNGKGIDVGVGVVGSQRFGSLNQQTDLEKEPVFQGATGSKGTSCGTGVFLPRSGSTAMYEPHTRRPGKGCSTVLIPERVVQALQFHFDQVAATSGPKPGVFPPLNDVLVSNRNGMYSLQKRQSRKKPTHVQNDTILPRDWTY